MRLSSHTDYALRTLIYVALHPDGMATINDVADSYRISKSHLMKIAQKLGQAGYLATVRGRGGGLKLGRAPAEMRLGDIVRLTENDLALVECMAPPGETPGCRLSPDCTLKSALGEALKAFLAVLDGYTLADIIRQRRSLSALLRLPATAG